METSSSVLWSASHQLPSVRRTGQGMNNTTVERDFLNLGKTYCKCYNYMCSLTKVNCAPPPLRERGLYIPISSNNMISKADNETTVHWKIWVKLHSNSDKPTVLGLPQLTRCRIVSEDDEDHHYKTVQSYCPTSLQSAHQGLIHLTLGTAIRIQQVLLCYCAVIRHQVVFSLSSVTWQLVWEAFDDWDSTAAQ